LLRRHEYLTRIIDHNAAVIDRYGENIRKVEADRNRLRRSEARLAELAEKERSTRAQVLRRKRQKRTLLARVKTEKDLHLSSIEELEESSRQLQALIEKLERESNITDRMRPTQFSAYKSKFIFPVDGDIITPFGKYEDEAFSTITFNNGIEIGAPDGSPFKAVFEGVVIYADWFKGYGKLIIIDHGDGYYTLSGHASKLLKNVGDRVTEGELIGYVGDTGSLKGSNLYFEIRHHGKPVDPLEWLAATE
jgi:murein DD-endopeptidase MepM/ murein hydrolase activator NlpD